MSRRPSARSRAPAGATAPQALLDLRLMEATTRVLLVAAVLLAAGSLAAWLLQSPRFAVRAIAIDGDTARNNVATIRANSVARLQGNFFGLDLARAKEAFESVPWVRRATVRRVWPDRLAVTLEEHRAAAWWHNEDGDDQLVNVQGEVFEANPGDVEDQRLPTLQGPAGSAPALLAMERRLAAVFAPANQRIESLVLSTRGSWRVAFDDGASVELGRGTDDAVVARTESFARSVGQLESRFQRTLVSADLRHADGYALKLQGIGTVDAAASAPPAAAGKRR